jgi:hypothetical protein
VRKQQHPYPQEIELLRVFGQSPPKVLTLMVVNLERQKQRYHW